MNSATQNAASTQTVRYAGILVTVIGAIGTDVLISLPIDGELWVRGRDLTYTGASLVCKDLSCEE